MFDEASQQIFCAIGEDAVPFGLEGCIWLESSQGDVGLQPLWEFSRRQGQLHVVAVVVRFGHSDKGLFQMGCLLTDGPFDLLQVVPGKGCLLSGRTRRIIRICQENRVMDIGRGHP